VFWGWKGATKSLRKPWIFTDFRVKDGVSGLSFPWILGTWISHVHQRVCMIVPLARCRNAWPMRGWSGNWMLAGASPGWNSAKKCHQLIDWFESQVT
jgi:hypothetical protein